MHKEILTDAQLKLLPLVKTFRREFYLVGGTAIALYIGHRRSIDFDLFTSKVIRRQKIKRQIDRLGFRYQLRYEDSEQLHIAIEGVKITFFEYPFEIPHSNEFEQSVWLPDLLDLAAMKAYAFGRRAKWKDYVDMYYILKDFYRLQDVSERASSIYGKAFSEKLFRQQLCFFEDIDYSEELDYMGNPIPDQQIQEFLMEVATSSF